MDNFRYYTEKLEICKTKYQEAVLEGNLSRINQTVRDATFICDKLFKNVIVEFSELTKVENVHHPLIVLDDPEVESRINVEKAINNIIVSPVKASKKCLNECGNLSEKDCCSKKCSEQYKVKKYRLKKKKLQLLTV